MMHAGTLRKGVIAATLIAIVALCVALGARKGEDSLEARVLAAVPPIETVEMEDGLPEPSVRLDMVKDPERGWNVVVSTRDFGLLPDGRGDGVATGYAYLSVDGAAAERLYAQWVHLPALSDGAHILVLSLRDSEFRQYQIDGEDIAATYEATLTAGAVQMTEQGLY